MFVFGVVCAFVLSFNVGVFGQTNFGFDVNRCTANEVEFSVLNGTAGGKVFIEGLKNINDLACWADLDGSLNQTFVMHFGTCQATPNSADFTTSIDFVVIVQVDKAVNIEEDKRVHVTCNFGNNVEPVEIRIEAQSSAISGFTPVTHLAQPSPVMALQYVLSGEPVDPLVPIEIGTNLKAVINLSFELPNYDLIVQSCSMNAIETIGTAIGSKLSLFENDCSNKTYFPTFEYSYEKVLDSAGTVYDVPIAVTDFSAFTPFLPGILFTTTNVYVTLSCTVNVCVKGSPGCAKNDCPVIPVRRKRQVAKDDDFSNSTVYDLDKKYMLSFGRTADQTSEELTMVNIGKDDMCMDRMTFWGALLALLALLVAAWLALCCFFIFVRRRRRREGKTIYIDDKSSTRESIVTPVEVNVIEKPLKTIPYVLPRYHPADFAVETVETVETRELA